LNDRVLEAVRDLITEDVGNRGLRTDPESNLINAYPHDFEAACRWCFSTTTGKGDHFEVFHWHASKIPAAFCVLTQTPALPTI